MAQTAKALFIVATIPFIVLGTLHNLYMLMDRWRPSRITPSDPAVRAAMEGARLRIHRTTDMWRAWVGFNFSHGLGAIVFGLVFLLLALDDFARLSGTRPLMVIATAVPLIYLYLAIRYWFIVPIIGIGIGAAAMLGAFALSF
ncbi:MAG: hypothetical protein KDE14_16665 [Rhodobacteraceae bacterium]|nr:hypothetical protein [Paracoccaceae bacterium]